MAKDPATLWYWNDWNGGTMTFTRHLKGCYMDLLSAQFNSGPLSLEEIKTILGSDFGTSWPTIQKKFKQADGLFFNERMEAEKEKRKQHSKKQSDNVKKRWDKYGGNTNVYTKTIPLENEIENEDVLISELEIDQAFEFMFRIGRKEFLKQDIISFWEAFKLHKEDFSKEPRSKQMQHFRDWLKFQKKTDGKTVKGSDSAKPGSMRTAC